MITVSKSNSTSGQILHSFQVEFIEENIYKLLERTENEKL